MISACLVALLTEVNEHICSNEYCLRNKETSIV